MTDDSNSDIKALVLDFGGVISRTLFETHDLTESALGIPKGTLTWRGPFDPDSDPLWLSMQRGEISERDYWLVRTQETGKLIGRDWSAMQDFVKAARGNDPDAVIRPQCLQAIKKAKSAGKLIALLSNELDLFYGVEFRQRLPLLEQFDLIVDASYTKILKPNPRAYAFITSGLNIEAEECVFVDDQQKNIDGAKAFGMHTVLFDVKNPETAYNQAITALGL